MQGTRKIIRDILEEDGFFVSPGMLQYEARIHGYEGTRADLFKAANRMVREGQIKGRRRGREQKTWYKLKEEYVEVELSHA